MHPSNNYTMRNANNTNFNTLLTYSFWLVKIHTGPTKSCGSHINLVGSMCWKMYVKICVANISGYTTLKVF